jgi:uncharacterized ion transporter superfamily protein YfcC
VYQTFTDKIASFFKGKEKILVALSTLLFACFAGVATDPFITLLIIPFVITIFSKLKADKLTTLSSTFGGVLVGIFGATYSSKIVGTLIDSTYGLGSSNVTYGFELAAVLVLFAIAYLLLTYFAISRLSKKDTPAKDIFAPKEEKTDVVVESKSTKKNSKGEAKKVAVKKTVKPRVNVTPLAVLLTVLFIITILAYIPWEDSFGITFFSDLKDSITGIELFGVEILDYLLGSSLSEFGNLDLFGICGYVFVVMLLIKIIYHIPMDKIIESFGEGIKTIGKSLVLVVLAYTVLEFTVLYPTIAGVVSSILGLGTNVFTLFLSGIYTSLFTVDFQYAVSTVGSAFATFKDANVAALILQVSNGIVAFIAPTSAILMVGLSMLDIKYKEYFKYIWKFLLGITLISLLVISILVYV